MTTADIVDMIDEYKCIHAGEAPSLIVLQYEDYYDFANDIATACDIEVYYPDRIEFMGISIKRGKETKLI